MTDYLWVFILAGIAFVSTCVFIATIAKSSALIKKLKLPKIQIALNFVLLLSTLVDIGLIIYVFILVKDQISILS